MTPVTVPDFEILVIGAGQAGLSVGYHLRRLGLRPAQDFLIVDHAPGAGGAWQFRWPSLTLSTVNGVHDLPGMAFAEALPEGSEDVPAAAAVPRYFELYEKRFELRVRRPVSVRVVCDRATPSTCPQAEVDGFLHAETTRRAVGTPNGNPGESPTAPADLDANAEPGGELRVRGIINATGTWDKPFIPYYRGAETFAGRQLHAHDYRTAAEFAGTHVVVVGAGITAVQLLDEISRVTTTTWVSRTEPRWREGPFTPEAGRRAVAMVEERVRRGLPPRSVVSVTGLPIDDRVRAARARGALEWHPMFAAIEPDGVRWADGSFQPAQVILWCTGFRSALDHLAPLRLRGPGGGITMTGRLATQVAADPRIHLIGYGPSASTVGANRAGRAAAVELTEYLSLPVRR
ncbi:NAD(P)/FAD-dependent oxidoreductase [Nocardia sp. CDC159]|uniref:NAD(P)/FAD-dependent oxidoreductase n=1 Tax=Nocardia pulmonis TaxID=2951408 RepID=A0A9X2IWS0_9NOCA|nr:MULTISPECIES: FAD-dependent oxidoreductase [Nocardia]MCM6773065.1 NAD(P)/FAD-dependent oxidoreductase [Nocardia pulmonis]MCM6785632.1 NAD(P)/FAD-dependent oxidoreductase [Nocardia sp. CDC159]